MTLPQPRFLAGLTVALAALTIAAVALSHAALTDIRHGESDVRVEWMVLQAAAVVEVALAASAIALVQWLRSHRRDVTPGGPRA